MGTRSFGFQAKAQIDRRDFNLVYNTFWKQVVY